MRPIVTLLRSVLVASLTTVAYTLVVYPVSIALAGLVGTSESDDSSESDERRASLPTVSLIVAAYNEEEVIAEKIENSLELEYPSDKLEIIVFSDASSDRTDDIVRSYESAGVELVRVEGRVGKTECQNVVAERADGEILVFSDANSMYEPDAIRALVEEFDDETGCVVGGLHYETTSENTEGIPTYRQFERFIQRAESRISSVVKGNGAIYAVRADDYVPLDPDLVSDFGEPLAIRTTGKQVKFAAGAVAREEARDDLDSQLAAQNRITTRVWHTFGQFTELLNPREYGLYAIQIWSRTVLLWLTPVFLGLAGASVVLLVVVQPSAVHLLFGGGLTAFALSLAGAEVGRRVGTNVPRPLQAVHYFGLLNYSLLVGLTNFLRGRNVVTWETDERASNERQTEPASNTAE